MLVILAALASLAPSPDQDSVFGVMTEYCEPFVRGDVSLEQTRTGLIAAGFTAGEERRYDEPPSVLVDGHEPPPDYPAREVYFLSPDGGRMFLALVREGPVCHFTQPGRGSDALTHEIEASTLWLAIPGVHSDWQAPTEAQWLSPDGRLVLTSDLVDDPFENATDAHMRQAPVSPGWMLANREAIFAADRRSPGEALVAAVQDMCLAIGYDFDEDPEHRAARIAASGGTEDGGLRTNFRHRDPETTITWIYATHCMLAAWGAGREEAVMELRGWLNDVAFGWSQGDQPDVWTRPGIVATLSPTDDGEAVLIHVRPTASHDE